MSYTFSSLTILNAEDKDRNKESTGRDRYELKNHINMNVYKLQ